MASTKEEKIKNLESKLKEIVRKKPEIKKENTAPIEEDEKPQVNIPNSVSELKASGSFRSESLGFDAPVVAGPGGRLENDLRDVPQPAKLDEQRKKEEAYQTAKLMYEQSESQRRIDSGRELMRVQAPAPAPMGSGFAAASNRNTIQMLNPYPEGNEGEGEQLYELTNNIKDKKKKLAWEVGVGENDLRKYN